MKNRRSHQPARCVAVLAWLVLETAHAVEPDRPVRDPMVAPIALQAPSAASAVPNGSAAASAPRAERGPNVPHHIVVIDGHRYVVDAGRRRGVGDLFGNARIERIEDSAIWVREAGVLQRLPMFGAAVRRAAAPEGSSPAAPTNTAAQEQVTRGAGRIIVRTIQPGEPS
jgi:hypothetical protein